MGVMFCLNPGRSLLDSPTSYGEHLIGETSHELEVGVSILMTRPITAYSRTVK